MGGRGLFEFEEMQQTYLAIKDLDSVIKGQSTTKLEDAWNVLQQISKDKFSEVYVNNILDNMRAALVKMYTDTQKSIDSSINLIDVEEEDSTQYQSDCICVTTESNTKDSSECDPNRVFIPSTSEDNIEIF